MSASTGGTLSCGLYSINHKMAAKVRQLALLNDGFLDSDIKVRKLTCFSFCVPVNFLLLARRSGPFIAKRRKRRLKKVQALINDITYWLRIHVIKNR